MSIGKYRLGFHKRGNCWTFSFAKDYYYAGKMTWWSFWRFYLVSDFC